MPKLRIPELHKTGSRSSLTLMAFAAIMAFACQFLAIPSAWAQVVSHERPRFPIRYFSDSEYPPYEFEENGKPDGFAIDLITAAAKATDRRVDVRLGTWSRVLPTLERGESDVAAGVVTPERTKRFDFSIPIVYVHYVLFVRKGSSIRSMQDAKGKSILVEKGDFINSYLKKTNFTSKITPASSPLEELRMLDSGRFDGAFVVKTQGLYYMRKFNLDNIEPSPAGFENVEFAFIVKKGNTALLRDIDEGLGILKANGTFEKLYDKWFGLYEETSLFEKVRYYLYALGVAVALLIAVSSWLWSLRRQVESRTSQLEEEIRYRANAESALDAQRRELQDYIDRLTTVNAKLSPDGTLLKVNRTGAELTGRLPEDLLGVKLWDGPWFLNSEADATKIREAVMSAALGTEQRVEAENVDINGRLVQMDLTITPVLNDKEEVVSIIVEGQDVTARKQAEIASREAGERLRLVLDTIPVRVFWKDRDLVYRGANGPFVQDAGMSSLEELVGKTDLEMPWTLQAEAYRADDSSVIESGIPKLDYDEIQQNNTGRTIWVRTSKVPLRDMDGQIIGVLGTYEDITPRKLAELQLRNSERRLANVLSFLPDPTFAIDLDGRVTLWNQAMEGITGVRSEDVVGKGNYEYSLAIYGSRRPMMIDLLKGEDAETEAKYIHFERQGDAVLAESHTPLIRPEGAYLWGKATILYDSEGNITGYIETMRDVTDRTLTEQALKESEEKFRALAENAEALIYIIQDYKFMYTNPYFTELLEYTEAELGEIGILNLVAPEYREDVDSYVRLRLSGGSPPPHHEVRILSKSGTEVWIDISGTRIEYQGQPTVVGVAYDITERRQAEDEKRAFYRETILSATDGKLNICDPEELDACLRESTFRTEISDPAELASVRGQISSFFAEHGLVGDRRDSLMIGVGEALDNSLKHAGSGRVYAGTDSLKVWVAVTDNGPGISSLILPKAVLRRGFSTKPSMGLGYSIMLDVSDVILLNTGKEGTTVVLVKNMIEIISPMLDSLPDTWDNVPGLK